MRMGIHFFAKPHLSIARLEIVLAVAVGCALLPVCATVSKAATEIPLEIVSPFTAANHIILSEAFGGQGYVTDSTSDTDIGTESAIANTVTEPASAASADPTAHAFGKAVQFVDAHIMDGAAVHSASLWSELYALNETEGVWSQSNMHQFNADATGTIEIGEPTSVEEGDSMWLESTITILGLAESVDPDITASISGQVKVGLVDLRYQTSGLNVRIFGTLSELSGTYTIDVTGPLSQVVYTARQYVSPNQEIEAFSIHSGAALIRADFAPGAQGVIHEALGRAVSRAFVGVPDVIGDYNGNGIVDTADYTIWRDHFGSDFQLINEAVGVTEGMVTIEDYEIWKSHFGNAIPGRASSSALPEPTNLFLILGQVTICVLTGWCRLPRQTAKRPNVTYAPQDFAWR